MSHTELCDPIRDQDRSPFADILDDLIVRSPAILGAVLVDEDGETVDYSGRLTAFQIKVTAAHMQIIRAAIATSQPLAHSGPLTQVCVRASGRTIVLQALDEGYALVLVLARCTFHVSHRAMARAIRALAAEAGWRIPESRDSWQAIEVEEVPGGVPRRPRRLKTEEGWESLEVLGTLVGLRHEYGYRVRTAVGAELTIVREPKGYWYVEG